MTSLLPGTQFSVSTSGTWLSPQPIPSTRTRGVRYLGSSARSILGIVLDHRVVDDTNMIYVMLPGGVTGWMPQGFVEVLE